MNKANGVDGLIQIKYGFTDNGMSVEARSAFCLSA